MSGTDSAPHALVMPILLAACEPAVKPAAPEIRPVRVVTVEERAGGDTVSLTGAAQAGTGVNLAFRIDADRAEGREAGDAIVTAGSSRLRPVASTVFREPMAFAIMDGLPAATMLTPVFLPTMHAIWFGRGEAADARSSAPASSAAD